MTRPEDALAAARRAAGERRYEEAAIVRDLDDPVAAEYASPEQLREWAFMELDAGAVLYSTRRFGAPITCFKRMALRALRQ